jgi:hypothetical protein
MAVIPEKFRPRLCINRTNIYREVWFELSGSLKADFVHTEVKRTINGPIHIGCDT